MTETNTEHLVSAEDSERLKEENQKYFDRKSFNKNYFQEKKERDPEWYKDRQLKQKQRYDAMKEALNKQKSEDN